MKINIKDLPRDKIVGIEYHNGSTVILIPHGRVRIMPQAKEPRVSYSSGKREGRRLRYDSI
ncbi:MAG: hypothetical protein QF381_04100 [Nitrososphaerales archaeon]|jgi:hypothetical protein|nr:hypothetical protein [Nitrososphaerales archaeon]